MFPCGKCGENPPNTSLFQHNLQAPGWRISSHHIHSQHQAAPLICLTSMRSRPQILLVCLQWCVHLQLLGNLFFPDEKRRMISYELIWYHPGFGTGNSHPKNIKRNPILQICNSLVRIAILRPLGPLCHVRSWWNFDVRSIHSRWTLIKKAPSQENIGCLDTNPGTGSTDVLSKNCMDESTRALYHGQMVCGGNACPNAARLWDEVREVWEFGGDGCYLEIFFRYLISHCFSYYCWSELEDFPHVLYIYI